MGVAEALGPLLEPKKKPRTREPENLGTRELKNLGDPKVESLVDRFRRQADAARTQNLGNSGTRVPANSESALRSHPDYFGMKTYVRKDTHRAVKMRLMAAGDANLSELVQELLEKWLDGKVAR